MRYWTILILILLMAIVTGMQAIVPAQPNQQTEKNGYGKYGSAAQEHPDSILEFQNWIILGMLAALAFLVRDYKVKMEKKVSVNCKVTARCARDIALIAQHVAFTVPPYNDD